MFNVDVTKMRAGSGLYIDILDTVAALLLRDDVVGRTVDGGQWESNFKWEWEERRNSLGEVVVGDCNTSESFRLCEEEVRRKFPDQRVYPLYLIISTDKTELTKFGMCFTYKYYNKTYIFIWCTYVFLYIHFSMIHIHFFDPNLHIVHRSLWPVYVTVGNLTSEAMNKSTGSAVTGFCPFVPYKSLELETLLDDHGEMGERSKGRRLVAMKHISRYNEQEFLKQLLTSIREAETLGPVKLQVGVGQHARQELFYPQLVTCVTDNEGGNQVMCIKSTKCKKPCRCCTCYMKDVCNAGKT